MKHLSLRLFAPRSANASFIDRLLCFTAKKINVVATFPERMKGKWRLYLNYCPECNSCAPKMHQCDVCHADTRSYFVWDKDVEQKWWTRYAEKHQIIL